jgi:hypothetical protein
MLAVVLVGNASPSEHLTFAGFCEVRVAPSLVLLVMICRSLFVLFVLTIVLSVLPRYTSPVYSFVIFTLCLYYIVERGVKHHNLDLFCCILSYVI